MIFVVLGAPGSGKTTITGRLRTILISHVVIDWDDLMPAVEALTGADVRRNPAMWQPYGELVRSVVAAVQNVPTVVFGVCTPAELRGWPVAHWMLLDCDDDERRRRLAGRPAGEIEDAIADATEYRRLGLPTIDSSALTVEETAQDLVRRIEGRPK